MKNNILRILFIGGLFSSCSSQKAGQVTDINVNKEKTIYPATRRDETVVDNYHGTSIADPYRWLENDHSDSTKAWVKAENLVTFGYLDKIPFRSTIKARLEHIWNYEKYGAPRKEGGKYYYFKNNGLQNQSALYVQDSLTSAPSLVLDPNTLSKDGTVALGGIGFNKRGDLLAYEIAKAGSDWHTIHVKDLKSGKVLEDKIEWVKFSGISWQGDGFYYSRYPEPKKDAELTAKSEFHQVWFHEVGTSQAADKLIFEDKQHPNHNFYLGVSEDEKFRFLMASESTSGNELYFSHPGIGDYQWKPIAKGFDHNFNVVEAVDGALFVRTNKGAPKYKVVAVQPNDPSEAHWKTILPESEDVLQSAEIIGGKLVASYLHNACSKIKVYDLKGGLIQELALPGIGSVGGFSGKMNASEAFYTFSAFNRPATIYQLEAKTLQSRIFKSPTLDFDSDAYETEQVFYPSKDGTKIPMFITHKKGLVMDGTHPTMLYGYGGFNISLTPAFALSRTVLLENGGIYAVANLRGGGEFGEEWHKAGTKERKQNVFDDFIAAAEYLISNKYTSKNKLAINGGSNGGLLVGACMTQRPDLFQVCFPQVGVMDMLRYDKFTIGRAWSSDYGLSEQPEAFTYLYKYSPLHNIKKVAYPATLVTTGDHDDRVVPAHSFKFAAEMQSKQQGNNPVLIRIETSAGHGAGKPTTKVIEETADILSFMFYNMGISPKS